MYTTAPSGLLKLIPTGELNQLWSHFQALSSDSDANRIQLFWVIEWGTEYNHIKVLS